MALNPLDILVIFLPGAYLLTHHKESFWVLIQKVMLIVIGISFILFGAAYSSVLSRGLKLEETLVAKFLVLQVAKAESALLFLRTPVVEEGFSIPFRATQLQWDEVSEKEMLELINEERVEVGLAPLESDPQMAHVARKHSLDMWQRQYFSHDTPEGLTPFNRMESGGVLFRRAGENLALTRSVERAHKGLMASEGHRQNILDPDFGRVGIGIIDAGIYGKMFTQDFAD